MKSQETGAILIDTAYYFIMGASIMMYQFEPIFTSKRLTENGKARMMLNRAAEHIKGAMKILDTFDAPFLKASSGNVEVWDFYQAMSYRLIAFGMAYLQHMFVNEQDQLEVLELIRSKGEKNETLDEIVDYYLNKSLETDSKWKSQ